MAAFVTVGTTCFNDLIREVNKPLFRETLIKYGYKKLFIQYGNGSIPPEEFVDTSVPLNIITFSFHENLDSIFSQCSLIICHGGAGTCMEALTPPGKRKLIIVINESLMNNHQEELASTLYEGKHAFVTRPPNLVEFLTTGNQPPFLECQKTTFWSITDPKILFGTSTTPMDIGLTPFIRGNPKVLVDYLNKLLGLQGA